MSAKPWTTQPREPCLERDILILRKINQTNGIVDVPEGYSKGLTEQPTAMLGKTNMLWWNELQLYSFHFIYLFLSTFS